MNCRIQPEAPLPKAKPTLLIQLWQAEKLRREMRELHKSGKDQSALTEASAKAMLAKGLDIRTRELELERTYSERFTKSVGALKTLHLIKAERDFNKEVLRRFRDRMEERRDGPPRGAPGRRQ